MRLLKSPEQGARTSIHLASSPEVDGITGQYFANRRPRRSSKRSYDEAVARRLWDVSCELVGIDTGASPAKGRRMRVGVHLVSFTLPGGPPSIGPTLAAVGRAAEDAGVDNLSLMDHYLQLEMMGAADQPMLEGYTGLGYLAGLTSTVELQLLVTGVTYRHPGLLAKIVSTLDVLSGGRAALGLGAAWYEREHRALGVPYPAGGGAVRASRGDAADRPADVERRRRTVRRAALPAGRDHQLAAAAAPPADHDRRRRREEDAAPGRASTPTRCNLFAGPDPAGPRRSARKLDVLREHCEREGTDYDRIRKTILCVGPLATRGRRRRRRSPSDGRLRRVGVTEVHVMPIGRRPGRRSSETSASTSSRGWPISEPAWIGSRHLTNGGASCHS